MKSLTQKSKIWHNNQVSKRFGRYSFQSFEIIIFFKHKFEYWWLKYHDFVPQQRKGQVSKSCSLNTVTKRSIQYYMCTYYVSASLYVLLVHLSSLHFRYDRPRTSKYLEGKTGGQKNSKKPLYLVLLRCVLFLISLLHTWWKYTLFSRKYQGI